jgi:hypothetical protein
MLISPEYEGENENHVAQTIEHGIRCCQAGKALGGIFPSGRKKKKPINDAKVNGAFHLRSGG